MAVNFCRHRHSLPMKSANRPLIESAINLLFSPTDFFQNGSRAQSTSMLIPLVLVLTACLFSLLNGAIIHHELFGLLRRSLALNPYLSQADRVAAVNGLAALQPLTFVAIGFSAFAWLPYWLLTAVLLANVAVLFDHEYKLKEILRFVGYGFAAFLPCLALSTALLLIHPATLSMDPLISSRGIGEVQAAIVDVTRNLTRSFPLTAVRNLTWTAIAWYEIIVLFAFRLLYRTRWVLSLTAVCTVAALLNGGSWLAQKAMGS